MSTSRILIIYTGGTIGMMADAATGVLIPMDMSHLEKHVPELARIGAKLNVVAFEEPLDSSAVGPEHWLRMANLVGEHYTDHDGFVILHGSDTMAFSATMLSFLLQGLNKPVVFTGSQLPIGIIRTDGKENLLTAIEIAAQGVVREVAIYFEYSLYRGNRTTKVSAEHFEAFRSPNYPVLAQAGVHIKYDNQSLLPIPKGPLQVHQHMDAAVGLLKIFPGIQVQWVKNALNSPGVKAVVVETFGSGNMPTDKALLHEMGSAIDKGITLINITQCAGGRVEQGKYPTSRALVDMGMVPGADLTTEAAVTKTMFLLGSGASGHELAKAIQVPLAGELTTP